MARTQRGRRSTAVMVTTMTDTDELLAQVAELRHQVAELATAKPTTAGPRFKPEFNTVYQAPVTGYLAVYFTGGRTGETRLLVGEDKSAHGMRRQGGGH